MEEKRKHRNKRDRECHAAETAEQKEHRLNNISAGQKIEQGMLLMQLLR